MQRIFQVMLASVWESANGRQNPQPHEERGALRGVRQSLGGSTFG